MDFEPNRRWAANRHPRGGTGSSQSSPSLASRSRMRSIRQTWMFRSQATANIEPSGLLSFGLFPVAQPVNEGVGDLLDCSPFLTGGETLHLTPNRSTNANVSHQPAPWGLQLSKTDFSRFNARM